MHPCQTHRRLVVAELGGDRSEPLVEDPGSVMCRGGLPAVFVLYRGDLADPLPTVGHDQGDKGACAGDGGEHQLCHADRIVHRDPLGDHKMRVAQQRLGGQPERSEPGYSNGEAGSQRVADPPQPRRIGVMQARQPLRDLCHTVTVRPMARADQP